MDKKKINKTHQKTNKEKNDNVVKLKTNFFSKNLFVLKN